MNNLKSKTGLVTYSESIKNEERITNMEIIMELQKLSKTNNITQTAVEWFTQKLNEFNGTDNPWFDIPLSLLEQAKEMEKEQMIDFAKKWQERQNDGNLDTIEMLYNETYNK